MPTYEHKEFRPFLTQVVGAWIRNYTPADLVSRITPIRLVRLPQEMVALVSLAGLAKAARMRRLGMQRRGGRRDPKFAGYMRPGMAQVLCKWRPRGVKIVPAGHILYFSLVHSSSDTLWRNFTKFDTGVQCNKGFKNMYKLGGEKLGGSKFRYFKKMSFLTFLDELWRNKI